MDQIKIDVAMMVVAATIVWIGGAYALEAWRSYRLRGTARHRSNVTSSESVSKSDDEHLQPPAEAA